MMDVEKRLTDLIAITTRLVDVLEREQTILVERRHADLHGLLDEKETIARVYQARVMGLKEDPLPPESEDHPDRDRLRELAKHADALIRDNALMLEAAMYASKRVVDLVAEAVKETSNPTGAYSKKGTTQVVGTRNVRGNAISFDQTL